jgi:uncharacterized membrane protein YcaP (DUF421 family)
MFLFGGMAVQAIITDDRSLTNALLAVSTITVMHLAVAILKQRSPTFGKIVDGTPIVLVEHGEWQEENIRIARVQEQDVLAAARQQGLERLDQIRFAIFERNGNISIIPNKA